MSCSRSHPALSEVWALNYTAAAPPRDELDQSQLWASRVTYVGDRAPTGPLEVSAKIRYNADESLATLLPDGDRAEIRFHTPQRAVTPGQAVVFYDGDEVVGGDQPRRRHVERKATDRDLIRASAEAKQPPGDGRQRSLQPALDDAPQLLHC